MSGKKLIESIEGKLTGRSKTNSGEEIIRRLEVNPIGDIMEICLKCKLGNICKYKDSVKILSYNKDIFTIDIKCKEFIQK